VPCVLFLLPYPLPLPGPGRRTTLDKFEQMVEQTVDLEAIKRHEFCVNPDFSEELRALLGQKTDTLTEMVRVRYTHGTRTRTRGARPLREAASVRGAA
jgi:hypothetical protein